jgi:hypothetical protein
MKKKPLDIGQRVDALDKLHECRCQVDFLREVFRGEPDLEGATEGICFTLQRIGKEMEECIHEVSCFFTTRKEG